MTAGPATSQDSRPAPADYLALFGWAFQHQPTREAYRRATGEDISPTLDRFRAWVEANLIGRPGEITDDADAAKADTVSPRGP